MYDRVGKRFVFLIVYAIIQGRMVRMEILCCLMKRVFLKTQNEKLVR